MKNFILVFILVFLTSCSDNEYENDINAGINDIVPKQNLMQASLQEKIDYKRHHLKNLTEWVSSNGLQVLNSVQKSNLNKDVFSIEYLFEESRKSKSFNMRGSDIEELNQSLDAFKNLNGESWYPILSVVNEPNELSKSADSTSTKTIIAVEDNDLNGETYTAYEIGENDELDIYDEELTPETTSNDFMIAIELGGCSDVPEITQTGVSCDGEFFGDASGAFDNPVDFTQLQLDEMKIKDRKEIWPFRSEISFKGYKLSNLTSNTDYACGEDIWSSVNCYNYSGKKITTLKRRDKGDLIEYNFQIDVQNSYNNDEILVYIIFEADGFPAPKKTAGIPLVNNSEVGIPYRSWNSQYHKQRLSNSNNFSFPLINNYSYNDSEIEYNFLLLSY